MIEDQHPREETTRSEYYKSFHDFSEERTERPLAEANTQNLLSRFYLHPTTPKRMNITG